MTPNWSELLSAVGADPIILHSTGNSAVVFLSAHGVEVRLHACGNQVGWLPAGRSLAHQRLGEPEAMLREALAWMVEQLQNGIDARQVAIRRLKS